MNKTVIVTGGSSGLGYEGAYNLAITGDWQVIIASRNMEKTTSAAAELTKATGHEVIAMKLDLGSFDSIRQFVADFAASGTPPLHAIVCNAGLTTRVLSYTEEGIEQLFGVNHLGHFLLVNLLMPYLQEPARIVFVSSATHLPNNRLARLFNIPAPKYITARALAYPEQASKADRVINSFQSYSTSKLCNILCAYEFARKFEGRDIGVFAIDPGLMPDTMFLRVMPAPIRAFVQPILMSFRHLHDNIRSMKESGTHLARLVTDPTLNGKTALYFDGLHEKPSSPDSYNEEKARNLWETSIELTEFSPELVS